MATQRKYPFSELHLADLQPGFSNAAEQRVTALDAKAFSYVGPAEDTAGAIVKRLNPQGFHFAFLDPYNLASLSFDAIRTLSQMKRIDFLMHISVQDIQRNTDRYTSEEYYAFDRFAPGWRSTVDLNQSLASIRAGILAHWKALMRGLGFLEIPSMELVKGTKKQRLYWLAFASRHDRGNEFWNKIRDVSGQREFGF